MIWVPAGLLDNNSNQKVRNHIFVASKADWDEIGGEADQYTSIPDDIDVLLE